jgi:hypothetical protein
MGLFGGLSKIEWTRTEVADGKLSFELPLKPRRQEMKKLNAEYHTCQVQPVGGSKMDIITFNVSLYRDDSKQDLHGWLEESVEALKGQVKGELQQKNFGFHGFPGKRLEAVIRGQRSRYLMVGFPGHLLTITVMQRENAREVPEDTIERVLGSLQAPGFADQQSGPQPGPPPAGLTPRADPVEQAPPQPPLAGGPTPGAMTAQPGPQPQPPQQPQQPQPPQQPQQPQPPQQAPPATAVQPGTAPAAGLPGQDEPLTGDRLTPKLLQGIFESAYIQTGRDDHGNLYATDRFSCWVLPDPAGGWLRFSTFLPSKQGDELSRLRYVNQVNGQLPGVRASLSPQGDVTFDLTLAASSRLTARAIITAFKAFTAGIDQALALDQQGILR